MSKKQDKKKPKVHKDLDGFDISVDEFGEVKSTFEIDKINKFLNRNVDDKKLRDREDLDELQAEEDTDDNPETGEE